SREKALRMDNKIGLSGKGRQISYPWRMCKDKARKQSGETLSCHCLFKQNRAKCRTSFIAAHFMRRNGAHSTEEAMRTWIGHTLAASLFGIAPLAIAQDPSEGRFGHAIGCTGQVA